MSEAVSAATALAAGATVVTATERLARTLVRRHDEARLAAGARAWPAADALPASAFLARLVTAVDPAAGLPITLPSAEIQRLAWLDAIAGSDGEAGVLASAAARAWHAAGLWGLTPARIRAASDSPDSEAFCGWADRYVERLQRAGYTELHAVVAELADGRRPLVAGALPRELVLAGFDPLPPLYRRLVARLEDAGVVVRTAAAPSRAARCEVRRADNPATELRGAALFARARLDANAGARLAIVLPDLATEGAAVRRALLDVLDPGWRTRPEPGQRLAVSLGRPLADYPVVHAGLAWLALLTGEATWPTVSQVLRSPFLGASGDDQGRARAELSLREIGRARPSPGDVVRALRRTAPATAERLERALAASTSTAAAPSKLTGTLGELLEVGGWPGSASGRTTTQALVAFRQLSETLAGCDRLVGRVTVGRLVELVTELARQRTFEPEADVAPVQVLGVLEAEGQDFDHLWLAGVVADRWPPSARPLALLPLGLQRAAGVPEAQPARLRELWERRFQRLAAAADEVVFSWAARDGEAEQVPSPLLAGLPAGPAVDESPAAATPDRSRVAGEGPGLVADDDPAPAFAAAYVRGGARVLSLQATAPAEAFVTARLGARPLPEAPASLGDAARGQAVHRLLQDLYARPECRAGLARPGEAELAAAYAAVVDPVLAASIPGDDRLAVALRALERARLWALVLQLRQLDGQRGDFTVVVEEERRVLVGGLEIALRLDRVEDHAGSKLVIDYKTGLHRVTAWLPPRPADAQLPLYALSGDVAGVGVLRLRPPAPELHGFATAALATDGLKDPASLTRLPFGSWSELTAAWSAALATLATEFRAGDFRLDRRRRPAGDGQLDLVTRRHELGAEADGDDALEAPANGAGERDA